MVASFFQFDKKKTLNAIENIAVFLRKFLICRANEKPKIG
jgi:hypothetical protein